MLNNNIPLSLHASKEESEPLNSNQVIHRVRRIVYEQTVQNSSDLSGRFHGEMHTTVHVQVSIRKQSHEISEIGIISLPNVRV